MLRIVIEVTGEVDDAQGVKEALAMELERFSDVRVVDVHQIEPEQMKIKEDAQWKMTAEREGAILEAALNRYGATAQRRQMIEEMAELTQALCKLERTARIPDLGEAYAKAHVHVQEEIADVQIMLNQMQLLFGDCTDWEVRKLEQLAARLGMEAGEA